MMTLQCLSSFVHIVGRRVLPVLLAAGGVCGLLWAASGQWLSRADAAPLTTAEHWEPAAPEADDDLERQATPPDTVELDGLVGLAGPSG